MTTRWEDLDAALRRLEPVGGAPASLTPLERARIGMALAEGLDAVASQPPDPAWLSEIGDFHPRLCEALARNPHVPAAWHLPLARTGDGLTHAALAARTDLQVDVLLCLLASAEPTIRSRVFAEHTDPALTAAALAHADPWIRAAAATRDDLPTEELARLAGDPDPRVRRRVAAHPRAGQRVLMRLGRDDDAGVRKAARAHPGWAPGWWEKWWSR